MIGIIIIHNTLLLNLLLIYLLFFYIYKCVQRKVLSFVGFSLGIPYEQHDYSHIAEALGLHTLAERRHMLSSKFYNDLLLNKINSPTLLFLVNYKISSCSTLSHITFHISSHHKLPTIQST